MLTIKELLSKVSTNATPKFPNKFYDARAEIINVKEIEKNGKTFVKITLRSVEYPIYASALFTIKGGTEKQTEYCLKKLADVVVFTGLTSGDLSDLVGKFIPAVISRDGDFWNASLLPTEREQANAMKIAEEWHELREDATPPPPVSDDFPF